MTAHPTVKLSPSAETPTALPTFMDHIRELQGRLFIIAIAFVAATGVAYAFFDKISNVILAPLGKDNELVYLTPGGAFSFIIKVCLYVGIIIVLPLIIYHLYRFVMPAIKEVKLKTVLGYTIASFLLAIAGILFAYFVSLPASLYFLTGFNLYHINPMLTIDSYFSFVMTYVLAGALLFQIPLIMMVIDSATPLKPSGLMKYQRHIIIGSFVVAAIISPTPDALNQTILASPMVGMYQVGVVAIWSSGRRRTKSSARAGKVTAEKIAKHSEVIPRATPSIALPSPAALMPPVSAPSIVSQKPHLSPRTTNGRHEKVRVPRMVDSMSTRVGSTRVSPGPARQVVYRRSSIIDQSQQRTYKNRSIDGMIVAR